MSQPNSPATTFAVILIVAVATVTEANLSHDVPRHKLRKRHQSTSTHAPPYEPRFDWFQREFLEEHNILRATVGAPPLTWDSTLARYAHDYAVKRRSDCNYRQHSGGTYGENLFWQRYRESSPRDVVLTWFEEQRFFDHVTGTCRCHPEREGCECGHYTNVIWATTTKVGCSDFVYCNAQKGIIVVCSYYPRGNMVGQNPLSYSYSSSSSSTSSVFNFHLGGINITV